MEDIRKWVSTKLWYQVPVSISVIDREFNIVEANTAFTHSYGEWKDRLCFEVYKGRRTPCESCPAVETFRDGKVRFNEERGVVRNGTPTHYHVQMVPLVRESGEIPYVIEMSTDITATKLLEAEKREAERLAAVGQTVAGLAHGLKNVLMGLDGGMYVMHTGIENGDAGRIIKGWDMLEDNISRITSFVREFLEFARGRTPSVSLVDPNRIARKVVELFSDTARLAGIELKHIFQSNIAYALMDEEEIHTALVNLVSNSLDACQISEKPTKRVTVSTHDVDGVLVYRVADNGVGMDYEIKKKIFTNFFSTKGSDKGTGLGLLTTRKIVNEHGGNVSFESKEGEGSVFRLEFPRDQLPRREDATGD